MGDAAARVGLVGFGWRAQFFARLCALLPSQLELVGIAVRRPPAEDAGLPAPVYLSAGALVAGAAPDYVITSVPWAANPVVVTALVQAGARVLCETPPAPDLAGLRDLWAAVGGTQRVQVAEQYLLMPGHAARRALVARGEIGTVGSVQVSSTHGYHAVAMMRGLLGAGARLAGAAGLAGVGFGPVTVNASRFSAPLADPLSRAGWSDDLAPKPADTTLAAIDFGDGLSGLVRSQLGYDLNLDGYDTEHMSFDGQVIYRNPLAGLRLMDEEIAIGTLMLATARWAHDEGPPPYPLAEACQDQLISLAIEESAQTGSMVRTSAEAWSR